MIRVGKCDDYDSIRVFDPFGGNRKNELASGHCLVSVEDHQVVAYITFTRDGFNGRPFIHFLAVSPEYQRRGIATNLLAAAENAIGADRVFISTEETNQTMQAVLKTLNWTEAGIVRGANTDGTPELYYYRDL